MDPPIISAEMYYSFDVFQDHLEGGKGDAFIQCMQFAFHMLLLIVIFKLPGRLCFLDPPNIPKGR